MRTLPTTEVISTLVATPALAAGHAHATATHGEHSGAGLLIAGLIPILGLALVGGVIYYAVRRAREAP
jgi:hypothetical protein